MNTIKKNINVLLQKIDKILRDKGMSKASFVRWGIEELEKQNNLEQSKIK